MNKNQSNFHMQIFCAFTQNGWKKEENTISDDEEVFSMTVLAEYEVKCYAYVSTNKFGYSAHGDYGVMWIEAEYENKEPFSLHDLDDIREGIRLAQDNLLTLGIPFSADYKFIGKNTYNKVRKNNKARKHWKIQEVIEESEV